jgi:hypothetical protein
MNKQPDPYVAQFPKGSAVKVADLDTLRAFSQEWKYHHPLAPEQLEYEGKIAIVESVGYYHGGDQLYHLVGVPGVWHPECLRAA